MSFGGLSEADILKEAARRGRPVELVSEEEAENRIKELSLCVADPIYWFKHYVRTYDPRNIVNPYTPMELWPRQEELIEFLLERIRNQEPCVIEKSRDVGVSWTLCGFFLWMWQFVDGFAGGMGSRKLEYVDKKGDPKTLFEKFRIILSNEPSWMKPPSFDPKIHDLESRLLNPDKKSTIIGEGGAHVGRGGRTSAYFLDEYNHFEDPNSADAALSRNTNVPIYGGTANGPIGIYFKRSTWKCFTFGWWDDPRRSSWEEVDRAGRVVHSGNGAHPSALPPRHDTYPTKTISGHVVRYPWYEADIELYKDQPWLRKAETDIDYIGTGHPCFDREFLLKLMEELKKDGIQPIRHEWPGAQEEGASGAWSGEVKIWAEPERDAYYLVSADVAEGESANTEGDPDYSVAHVYDLETWEQVAVYKGRCETTSFALDLAVLGEMYNFAELIVERNGPGLAVIKSLVETDIAYPNVFGVAQGEDGVKHGMTTTPTSKKTGIKILASIIVDMKDGFEGFRWNDPETLDEMFYFVVKPNGRANAEAGHHDDHCTCARQAAMILPERTTRRQVQVSGRPDTPRVPYSVGRRR